MRNAEKVIITCAITGSVHTPTMSPHLPITPDEIAAHAIGAAEAGASILHLHARDPENGRPTADPGVFMQFLPRIKQATDAVVNITTGGGLGMSLDDRLAAARLAQPEVISLNMGSMNFGCFELATKYDDWKFDWERPYLESTKQGLYPNTFAMIEEIITTVGHKYGTKFEFECYDLGHLQTIHYYAQKGLIKPPYFIQCILGVHGGMGADVANLVHMRTMADRLFGDDYYMSVLAIGKDQMRMLTAGAVMGANVRCGLEDSLYIGRGRLAVSSAEQVAKIRRILEALGFEIATPADARRMLDLKGGDAVNF